LIQSNRWRETGAKKGDFPLQTAMIGSQERRLDTKKSTTHLLIGAEGRARLAPLYDIASILPYDFDMQKVRLAMKVGGIYRLRDVGPHQWRKTRERSPPQP
jgi:hypothetical protein